MANEFLSICVPTRNRSHLLKDLLTSIGKEVTASLLPPEAIRIYVSDNASTDETGEMSRKFLGHLPHFTYWRNESNLGAIRNVIACATKASGRYQWIIGDDETVRPGALNYILDYLKRRSPSWFINSAGDSYGSNLRLPREFVDVREFVRVAAKEDPGTLITAGTISLNIFKAECFEAEIAEARADKSTYAHFFGLMSGLKREGGLVFMTNHPTITVRAVRPRPADGEMPPDSDKNWAECMSWLKAEFDLPELDVHILSKLVSQSMIDDLKKDPLRTIRNHAALLMMPSAYPRIFKRLLALWK